MSTENKNITYSINPVYSVLISAGTVLVFVVVGWIKEANILLMGGMMSIVILFLLYYLFIPVQIKRVKIQEYEGSIELLKGNIVSNIVVNYPLRDIKSEYLESTGARGVKMKVLRMYWHTEKIAEFLPGLTGWEDAQLQSIHNTICSIQQHSGRQEV